MLPENSIWVLNEYHNCYCNFVGQSKDYVFLYDLSKYDTTSYIVIATELACRIGDEYAYAYEGQAVILQA